jgi:hypothetical protein
MPKKEQPMAPGESQYGVPDIVYDIVVTVANLLQGEEQLRQYASDADRAGDAECATAFRTVAEANRVASQALLRRLKDHLNEV